MHKFERYLVLTACCGETDLAVLLASLHNFEIPKVAGSWSPDSSTRNFGGHKTTNKVAAKWAPHVHQLAGVQFLRSALEQAQATARRNDDLRGRTALAGARPATLARTSKWRLRRPSQLPPPERVHHGLGGGRPPRTPGAQHQERNSKVIGNRSIARAATSARPTNQQIRFVGSPRRRLGCLGGSSL